MGDLRDLLRVIFIQLIFVTIKLRKLTHRWFDSSAPVFVYSTYHLWMTFPPLINSESKARGFYFPSGNNLFLFSAHLPIGYVFFLIGLHVLLTYYGYWPAYWHMQYYFLLLYRLIFMLFVLSFTILEFLLLLMMSSNLSNFLLLYLQLLEQYLAHRCFSADSYRLNKSVLMETPKHH